MSDTPRTDAFAKVPSEPQETWAIAEDWARFARQLERELAASEASRMNLIRDMDEMLAAAESRGGSPNTGKAK